MQAQTTGAQMHRSPLTSYTFTDPRSHMFDVNIFTERLAARGVRTSTSAPAHSRVVSVKASSYRNLLSVLNTTYSAQQHIR